MMTTVEERGSDGSFKRVSYSPLGWAAAFAVIIGTVLAIFR